MTIDPDQLPDEAAITFNIVDLGTQRGKRKLVSRYVDDQHRMDSTNMECLQPSHKNQQRRRRVAPLTKQKSLQRKPSSIFSLL